jgi:hypothetical protein
MSKLVCYASADVAAVERDAPLPAGLSTYERQRLENIARNNEVLASLGILGCAETSACPQPKLRKRARNMAPPPRSAPTRRSSRGLTPGEDSNSPVAAIADDGARGEQDEAVETEVVEFERSAVVRYALGAARRASEPSDVSATVLATSARPPLGLRRLGGLRECVSTALARLYTLDVVALGQGGQHGGCGRWLIAAGGEKGIVEVYGLRAQGADAGGAAAAARGGRGVVAAPALLSFEAHRGWVGGV